MGVQYSYKHMAHTVKCSFFFFSFPFPGSFEEIYKNICPVLGLTARFFSKLWFEISDH